MSEPIRICPSVLSADLGQLAAQVRLVEDAGADWLHVDVMDGHFVPNLTFGAPLIKALRDTSDLPLDVHLMVQEPERYIDPFAQAGASVFTFHPEATIHVQRQLATVRSAGMAAGLALNPATPFSMVEETFGDLDLLLIMSVNPGFGGQSYLASATDKIRRARQLIDSSEYPIVLQVDGGINPETIISAREAGADAFVAGNAIFGAEDPAGATRALRQCCQPVA